MNEPRSFQPQGAPLPPYSQQPAFAPQGAASPADFDPLDMTRSPTGFDFTGIDSLGASINGFVKTTDMELARKELQRAGVQVTSLTPRRMVRQKVKKPTMIEFASLAEQFGDMMEIGESPVAVCRLLAYTQTNKYLADALMSAGELIMNGWTLSEAFAAQRDKDGEQLFPVTFICALRIGEEVGTAMDETSGESQSAFLLTLKRFSETQKKADSIRSNIRGALMYPIAVIGFCILASGIVLYFVMPRMVELYTGLLTGEDRQLPFITRILIGTSEFLLSWWGIALMLIVVGLFLYLFMWARTAHGLDTLKIMSLRMPLFGQFFRRYYAAQTLRTLALLSSGIPSISERFAIAAETSTNPVYQEMLLHIRDRLMVESIDLSKLFVPYPYLMGDEFQGVLLTFEKTADMQGTFHNYAKVVETRAERDLEKMLFWFQNFAIVPVGIFVAVILIALYSPMFNLAEKLGG